MELMPQAAAPEHRRIPLAMIELDPTQPRQETRAGLDELASSMGQHGQLQPVIVAGWPDASRAGYYRVVAGERRVRAARQLGWPDIDAILMRPGARRFLLAVTENIQRKALSRPERKHAFERMLEECGGDKGAAASLLGVSQTTFYRTIAEPDAEGYANWSPRGTVKRLERAAAGMPAEKRAEMARQLRELAERIDPAG
jgi:ParB/RepB/Spo0J family partition protein